MVTFQMDGSTSIELNGDVIVEERSEFQRIVVVDTPRFGRVLLIGNKNELIIQLAENDESLYHEAVVHPAMALHDNPKNVLVIGGGDGGSAREVLKHGVEKLTIVDLDEHVVDICKKYIPIHQGALDDSRVKLIIGDGKKFIEQTEEKFDVIILDLTDPEEASKLLFTREFYQCVKERLSEGGTLSLQTSSPDADPQVLGRVYAALNEVFLTVIPYVNFVPSYFDLQCYCLATDIAHKPIARVIHQRKIQLSVYTPEQLDELLMVRGPHLTRVLTKKWKPSTDDNPVVYS
jgi:spermidine synthase